MSQGILSTFERGRINTTPCEGHDGGFDTLSVIGDPISDEDRVVHLLASLSESYEMIVMALKHIPLCQLWKR